MNVGVSNPGVGEVMNVENGVGVADGHQSVGVGESASVEMGVGVGEETSVTTKVGVGEMKSGGVGEAIPVEKGVGVVVGAAVGVDVDEDAPSMLFSIG